MFTLSKLVSEQEMLRFNVVLFSFVVLPSAGKTQVISGVSGSITTVLVLELVVAVPSVHCDSQAYLPSANVLLEFIVVVFPLFIEEFIPMFKLGVAPVEL